MFCAKLGCINYIDFANCCYLVRNTFVRIGEKIWILPMVTNGTDYTETSLKVAS